MGEETKMSPSQLASYIDHSLLKPDATRAEVKRICDEAYQYRFHAVCVNGSRVALAASLLEDSGIKVAATVGFPLGAVEGDVKRYETEAVVDNGAHEIDMVLNLGLLKQGESATIQREIRDVTEAAEGRPVKVIIEACLLTHDEKVKACKLVTMAGAHFVKTSTGFSRAGATFEDVKLLRQSIGEDFGVKAAGGIRDTKTALAMIDAGASRLGTSSSARIIDGLEPAASSDNE